MTERFEGRCPHNSQAQRGYSRGHRPDCKQVVIGLVLDRDGFPKAHEGYDGNRHDQTTVGDMLTRLEERTRRRGGATVVVDLGMAFAKNLAQIRTRGHHYLVAARHPERGAHQDAFAADTDWTEVVRVPSPRNPGHLDECIGRTNAAPSAPSARDAGGRHAASLAGPSLTPGSARVTGAKASFGTSIAL